MKIELTKAITYQGKEYKKIDFDFDSLTGAEILDAKSTMVQSDIYVDSYAPQLSMEFQARVAARAGKVPYEVIKALPAREFLKVAAGTKDFLLEMA